MCHFITVGIQAGRTELLNRLEACGFALRPSENLFLRRVFPDTTTLFEVTKGWCSCSLALGETKLNIDKMRERYRRKGWSTSKIERAIASREHSSEAHQGSGDNAVFLSELSAIAHECSPVYLYSHWYEGALADEEIICEGNSNASISELRAQGGAFPMDRLLSLTP